MIIHISVQYLKIKHKHGPNWGLRHLLIKNLVNYLKVKKVSYCGIFINFRNLTYKI